jgi:hypothetical protein
MKDYSSDELALIDKDMYLIFARDGVTPPSDVPYEVHFHRALTSFTAYPRSEHDIVVNELLWKAVRDSSFRSHDWADAKVASQTTGVEPLEIFAAGIPTELVRFLEAVSIEEMHKSVLLMLADAAQGEDADGLQRMKSELAPSFWRKLNTVANLHDEIDPVHSTFCPAQQLRWDKLSFSSCLDQTRPCATRQAAFMLDQALHKSQVHDYWLIDIQGAAFHTIAANDKKCEADADKDVSIERDVADMTLSLYNNWCLYANSCMIIENSHPTRIGILSPCSSLNRSNSASIMITKRRKGVLNSMMTLVREQRQRETWESLRMLLLCAKRKNSWLGRLPLHLVHHAILPRVVISSRMRAGAEPVQAKFSLSYQTVNIAPDTPRRWLDDEFNNMNSRSAS